ncbi:efflux transporter outer membrane subunit [Martelella limonii]|uniref:efflux transporter outer membrane subunit n=1 Tax=Martelella limonii TaxID=1647649 RepID=UPI0015801594|nr:efflux transporter outer membrane subunit [Martelella limonii]
MVTGVRLSALAALSLALSSCVVGPDYHAPALPLPAKWASSGPATDAQSAPVLADWWKRFNDPVLDQLVDQAIQSNRDIAKAKAAVRAARATEREQSGALFPALAGSASATDNRAQTNASGSSDYAQYEGGFDSSWELDLFGGNKRAVEAQRYAAQSTEEELRDTLVTVIGDVASYYIDARAYQQLAGLAQRSAASQWKTARLTKSRLEVGLVSDFDLRKAEAQAASTEADVPSYQISYTESVNRLAVLLARPASEIDAMLGAGKTIPAPPGKTAVGIPAEVLVTRPDVRSAERQLAEATAKIGEAEANRYPSLSLTGSISTSATSLSELGEKSTIGWSWGPQLSIPIFQGGQLKAAVDVAKAQRDQSLANYQSAVLNALEEVDNAIIALNRTRTRIGLLSSSANGYRDAVRLSKQAYEAGETDLFDTLDSERSLYSTEESLIQSRANVATYYVALNKALGGGWSGMIDVSKPLVEDTQEGPHVIARK